MRILYVATKTPVPPIDGGRVLILETLRALRARAAQITFVAQAQAAQIDSASRALEDLCQPRLVPASAGPLSSLRALARTLPFATPWSVARHTCPGVRSEVGRILRRQTFDAIHVEQLQAINLLDVKTGVLPPVVLRMQNVESDLWRDLARTRPLHCALALGAEAKRLARFEARVCSQVASVIALTPEDMLRLNQISRGRARVQCIPAPFPRELPSLTKRLRGQPPLVIFGSGGWRPNRDATDWFVRHVWPTILARQPEAWLHVFGDAEHFRSDRVAYQPAPRDSAEAFPAGSVLVVPLRVASGVRIKILEAWARRIPVVASPVAARGLLNPARPAIEIASTPDEYAEAIAQLDAGAARGRLVEAGVATLAACHDPRLVASQLMEAYRSARSAARRSTSRPQSRPMSS